MDEINQVKEAAWNLSQFSVQLISKLMSEAITSYCNGEITKAFSKWKGIYFIVSTRFTVEEKKELRKIEIEGYTKAKKEINQFGKPKQYYDTQILGNYLEDYIDKMNELFRKYKLDIADKEVKTRLT